MNRLFIIECRISFFLLIFLYRIFPEKESEYYYYTSEKGKRYRCHKTTQVWERQVFKGILRTPLFQRMYVKPVIAWRKLSPMAVRRLEIRMKKTQ